VLDIPEKDGMGSEPGENLRTTVTLEVKEIETPEV
jgi:hypothetical protein